MKNSLNGINLAALTQFAEGISQNPTNAKAKFSVTTDWEGQTRTVATVKSYDLLGKTYEHAFKIAADEPTTLLGRDTAPNPQELLMAALNACMSVGYVATAATKGVTIHSLQIETTGELDLRGFLGLDENVNPGYNEVHYTVHIDADGTPEQMEEIHQTVIRTSPNFANFSKAIRMVPKLVVAGK
jgi:uncharacterized OsmC-like protein